MPNFWIISHKHQIFLHLYVLVLSNYLLMYETVFLINVFFSFISTICFMSENIKFTLSVQHNIGLPVLLDQVDTFFKGFLGLLLPFFNVINTM